MRSLLLLSLLLAACGAPDTTEATDAGFSVDGGTDGGDGLPRDTCGHVRPNAFANKVISFKPGEHAGFGQDRYPCIVLGGPEGGGDMAGSLDVLSLGSGGEIVLSFEDVELVDGPGPDLLVFENSFSGYVETASVAVSIDGTEWHEWTCTPEKESGYPGCAGVASVRASSVNGIDATDPAKAGGDAFDLADLGLFSARFVRIRDTGTNPAEGISGGFDLDAIAAVHSQALEP
jgi:hypothetical protein